MNRKSIRKRGYDYSAAGCYFVTVCVLHKEMLLGRIDKGIVLLNDFGKIVERSWLELPHHFIGLRLDSFVVMSNHFHGLVIIESNELGTRAGLRPAPTNLSEVVGGFKSFSSRRINEARNSHGLQVWQRNYYDHIIRTDREYNLTRLYILANPFMWKYDPDNPAKNDMERVDYNLVKQCGFGEEDFELIRNYLENRKIRNK
jgi:REP-associated tyrosine transposase